MKKTIIDKATAGTRAIIRTRKTKHPEEHLVWLAIAWLEGRIGNRDLVGALDREPHAIAGCITTVMNALRRAIVAGSVRIK